MSLPCDIAAVRGLQEYIKEKVSEFNEVFDEFPAADCEVELPSCSISTVGTPLYTNLMPEEHKRYEDEDNSNNDTVIDIIGQYDARYQVDIFAGYKIQRSRLMESVIDALNLEQIESDLPSGLSLVLEEYHDVIARYDQVGYTYIDGEQNSQKGQWRVKLDLIVNYSKVIVRSIPRINEITVTTDIAPDDNLDIQENFTV